MQELIDALVQQLNVDSKQAAGGAGILFKAARDKLGPGDFNQMLGGVAGIDELIREAPAAAGFGKLFGGVASAVGGGRVAMLAGVISGFGKLGLTQEHARQFLPIVLGHLQTCVTPETLKRLEAALRA